MRLVTLKNILFLLYILISLITTLLHEPWSDEAQAWLIVRDCNFQEMLEQIKYEGTPMLWHFILSLFNQLNLPYYSMNLFHWMIAVGIVYLFLYHSPFSSLIQYSFVFSYFILFEYSIKARSYSLSILFLCILATLYNRRFSRPILYSIWIALLCQTNIFGIFAAIGLSVVFFFDIICNLSTLPHKKWVYISSLIWIGFSGLLAVYQLYPPKSATHGLPPKNIFFEIFINFYYDYFKTYSWNYLILYSMEMLYVLSCILLFVFVNATIYNNSIVLFFIPSMLLSFWLQMRLPFFVYRHYGFFLIFPIITLWIYQSSQSPNLSYPQFKKYSLWIILAICVVSIPFGLYMTIQDWHQPFSGAQDIAQYLIHHNLDKQKIIAHPIMGLSILPYLSKETKFWYPHNQQYGTFAVWDKPIYDYANEGVPLKKTLQEIDSASDIQFPCLLIFQSNLKHERLRSVYANTRQAVLPNERYEIYLLQKP